jgi:hypothetical protein
MRDGEFYTNPRLIGQQNYPNPASHKYVLDSKHVAPERIVTAHGIPKEVSQSDLKLDGDLAVLTKQSEVSKPENVYDVKVFSTGGKNTVTMSQANRMPLPQYQQLSNASQDIRVDIEVPQPSYFQPIVNIQGQTDRITNIDVGLIQQVYQNFLNLSAQNPNAQIKDVLRQEPFATYIQEGLLNEKEVERAVYTKIYVEEESQDIQKMIAQFYNKFDELHE